MMQLPCTSKSVWNALHAQLAIQKQRDQKLWRIVQSRRMKIQLLVAACIQPLKLFYVALSYAHLNVTVVQGLYQITDYAKNGYSVS